MYQRSLNLLHQTTNHLVEVVIVEDEVEEVHVVGGEAVNGAEEEGVEENVVAEVMIMFNRTLQRQQISMIFSNFKLFYICSSCSYLFAILFYSLRFIIGVFLKKKTYSLFID